MSSERSLSSRFIEGLSIFAQKFHRKSISWQFVMALQR